MCSVESESQVNEKFIQHVPGRIHAVKDILSSKLYKLSSIRKKLLLLVMFLEKLVFSIKKVSSLDERSFKE